MRRRERMMKDLEQDIRNHIEIETQDNIARGMSAEEARLAAVRKFGNAARIKEETRDVWSWVWVEQFLQDIHYGLRMLWKSPGFTVVAVLTLALGIGANTAIFSVVYAVLLRPLPFADASRLVMLNETTPNVGTVSVSYPNFIDWRNQSRSFSRMAAVCQVGFNLAGVSQPESINGVAVSPNFLSILGVRPMLGRDFEASEENAGAAPVLLLGYDFWQSHFGGDANAIGRTMLLDGRTFTIVGVLPAGFRLPDKTDVIEPMGVWATSNSSVAERGERGDMTAVGRLGAGVSFREAKAEMDGIAARLAKEYPASNDRFGVELRPMRDVFVAESRPAILILFGAVVFVLLIACANVGNLFLVRGSTRAKEITLRFAFGASRSRIVRQMLTESLILACLGGALGFALAVAGIHGIVKWVPMDVLAGAVVNLNGAVFGFVAGLVVVTAFIFGLAPAAQSSKADMQSGLKESSRTTSASVAQSRLRMVFAVAEISLALILLVGAGLMMKSLYRLMTVDPGFRPERVLTMHMDLPGRQYPTDPAVINFWQKVLDGLRAIPGVESAAVGTVVPLTGQHSRSDVTIEGMAAPRPGDYPHPDVHIVSADYMITLGISLLRGRTFTETDAESAPRVGMINALMARRFFPNEDVIGKRFMMGHPGTKNDWITIVGLVGDTKLYGLANPARLEVYLPFRQDAANEMELMLKSGGDPAALTSEVRAVIASIDKDQPISEISTMNQLVRDSVSTRRITLVLLGLFSALALILAAIGIYGVISYSVAQRTHEIGIRTALGAQQTDLLRMVLKQGVQIAAAGVGIGFVVALGLTRLLNSMLYGVGATDPVTFVAVSSLLMVVALAACYIPARRATRVDPLVALRYE